MRRLFVFLIFLLMPIIGWSQDPLVLYPMSHIVPRSNQMNPALQLNGKFFIAFPIFSGTRVRLQSDLALNNMVSRNANDSLYFDLNKVLNNVHNFEKINLDANFDLLQFGFRLLGGYFMMNASLYDHADLIISKDLLTMLIKGNGSPEVIGKRISLGAQEESAYMYTKIGFGYSRELIPNRFTAGIRLNLLNGMITASLDSRNTGYFYTDPNSYQITFNSGSLQYNLSGNNSYLNGKMNPLKGFSYNNPGFSADAGAIWKINDKWSLSGSVTDLGYIFWKDDVTNYTINSKSYTFTGINLDNLNNIQSIGDTLNSVFDPVESHNKFKTGLHPKSYVNVSYNLGNDQELGLITKNTYLRTTMINSTGISYHKRIRQLLDLSAMYSLYDLHYSQIGLGFALNLGGYSLYLASDNIIGFINPSSLHGIDLSFGMNFIF